MRIQLRHILLLFLAILLSSGCQQEKKRHDFSIFVFGTLVDITFYDVDKKLAESAIDVLEKDFERYHQNWSPWTNGDLAKLNHELAVNGSADLPTHLVPLIKQSMQLSQQSKGYFNPAIGRLINLWQFHKYQEADIRPPDPADIQALVEQKPSMSDLRLAGSGTLQTTNSAVSLNFGAYAKGYAIQLEIQKLQQMGIENAVINAGGDLSVIGNVITDKDRGRRAWNIGIRHPRKDTIMASVELGQNESVFTSGDYERYYLYQGRRYHHILDPATGYPTNDARSVTVIHKDAALADAAATALFVAGSERWQEIAKAMGISYVMLMDAQGTIWMTAAMAKRLKILDKSLTSHKIIVEEL